MDSSDVDTFLAAQGVVIHQDGLDDVLEHFGVKGMHWGDRKADDHENGAGGSTKESASPNKHVGAKTTAVGVAAGLATLKVTGRPALAIAAGAGAAYGTHHALTHPHDLEQHVDHGKAFVAAHHAVKK